jgi:hypothetical protein
MQELGKYGGYFYLNQMAQHQQVIILEAQQKAYATIHLTQLMELGLFK